MLVPNLCCEGSTNSSASHVCATCAQAQGRVFYIDRGNFQDKALMQRLMPWANQQEEQQQQQQEGAAAHPSAAAQDAQQQR
jgi:protein-arginine kinase activator protein McsA